MSAERPILAAEPHRRDLAAAARIIDPGPGDGENAGDIVRPQQGRERRLSSRSRFVVRQRHPRTGRSERI